MDKLGYKIVEIIGAGTFGYNSFIALYFSEQKILIKLFAKIP